MWRRISAVLVGGTAACGVGIVAQTAPAPAPTVLKANTQTVPIDVVVLDRGGRPVTGLKRENFSVQQDGAAQAVTFF